MASPEKEQLRIFTERDREIPAYDKWVVLDEKGKGTLESIILVTNDEALGLLLEFDEMDIGETIYIANLVSGKWGIDEKITAHFYLIHSVPGIPRYTVAYDTAGYPDRYERRIRFVLVNPTDRPITIEYLRYHRHIIVEEE